MKKTARHLAMSVVWFGLTALTLWSMGLDAVQAVRFAWLPFVGVLVGLSTLRVGLHLVGDDGDPDEQG